MVVSLFVSSHIAEVSVEREEAIMRYAASGQELENLIV
jgi:hypothetical protein